MSEIYSRLRSIVCDIDLRNLKVISSISIAFGLCISADAQPTAKSAPMKLAPFTYDLLASNSRDSDLNFQKSSSVCRDFVDFINNPRSNYLFKPDGALVRQGGRIKSVIWETLDKDRYVSGFDVFANFRPPKVSGEYVRRYGDPRWVLQRTVAYPSRDYSSEKIESEVWLYRLVLMEPHTRGNQDFPNKVELPAWFPADSVSWVGNAWGEPNGNDRYGEYDGFLQWIIHDGVTYAVRNVTFGDGARAIPKYLVLNVDKLVVYPEGASFLRPSCAFHAPNKE